ncbi:MAG: RNA methyltransferase [Chitinophagales bacterium]|nr:RNA methyltransferase [Chitinophagales bacterium]
MLSKNEIKYIQSLFHKKQRQQENIFIAEGTKIVYEILNSNYSIKKIYTTTKWLQKNFNKNNTIIEISDKEMERISGLQTYSPILALVEQKPNESLNPKGKINLVLDGIQDPGNFGTIIRIADWFGVQNIFCSEDTVDVYNNKVIQSSMGSFVRTKIWYGDIEKVLKDSKIEIYGAVLNGKNFSELPSIKECFLVIGNEGNGVRKNIMPFLKHPITIPKKGGAESLNAAIATGILLSKMTI